MPPLEPTLAALPNPLLRYFAATRPAFLSVTFVGCLLGLASAFAAQAAIAIENARLFAAERRSRLELKSIQTTSALLRADLHIETLLDRIVAEAKLAFRADATSLMLLGAEGGPLTVAASQGLSPEYARQQQIAREVGVGVEVVGHEAGGGGHSRGLERRCPQGAAEVGVAVADAQEDNENDRSVDQQVEAGLVVAQ